MRIALIGISGRVGSRLAAELLKRGHAVTGIARDISKVEAKPGLSLKAADATRLNRLLLFLKVMTRLSAVPASSRRIPSP